MQSTLTKVINGGHIYLIAKYKHEPFNVCKNNGKPIVIKNPVTISGLDYIPVIKCSYTEFLFLLDGTNNKVNVKFEDVAFQNNEFKRNKTCKPTENGVIKVVNANIVLNGCYFQNVCTGLLVNFRENETYSVTIDSTEFNCISYALYSNGIDNGNISIDAMKVIGNADKIGSTSHAISLTSYNHLQLKISNSAIKKTHEGISLTIRGGISNIEIDSIIISENIGQGVIIIFSEKTNRDKAVVSLTNAQFVKNKGIFASAIHLVDKEKQDIKKKVKIYVTECIFYENQADTFFGSIYADGVHLYVVNSFFTNNVAGELHGTIQGFGGAIYIETKTTVAVTNSTFINNTCSGFGGTIFSRGKFSCVNCEFTGASEILIRPLLGDILYATAGLTLINTTWKSTVMNEIPKSLIWHPGSPTVERWGINVSGYFEALCPEGHNISHSGIVREQSSVSRIAMSCKPCPRNEYSLTSGALNVRQSGGVIFESQKTIAECHHCKYGGVCEKGSIRPQANYYGYRTGSMEDEVRFIPCPIGYCCQGDSCRKYNSCQNHREGLLCGKCKTGMSENLINSNCANPRECNDHWFWIFYLPLGILYVLSFMYLDKISTFIKQQLIWWDNKIHYRHDLEDYEILEAKHAELLSEEQSPQPGTSKIDESSQSKDDVMKPEPENDDINSVPISDHHKKDIFKKPGTNVRGPDLFTDILNISFYFYQMFLLMRMRESIVLDYILSCLRSLYSSIFTLSVNGSSSMLLCPIRGLTAVTKLLFVKSFACYVLLLIFIFHIIVYVVQFLLLQDLRRKEALIVFSIRLKVATIQILLLSYSTLSETAVTLVSCIPMNSKFVLLIDGTITCYTWWQVLIFIFVLTWVIPFPVVLVYSLIHLKKDYITYHQFILAWALPLAYMIWLIFTCKCTTNQTMKKRFYDHESLDTEERLSINETLYRLECPYVGKANHHLNNRTELERSRNTEEKNTYEIREPAFWQGAMIGRRLILIMFLTFVPTPVSKYYCALFLCVLYLVHQLYYRPYLIKLANMYETLTSVTLVLFCSMNLFFAYSYMSDVPPEAADENLSIMFHWFEAIILVVLPTIVVFVLFCLVMTRVIILTVKLIAKILECCW